MIQSRDKHLMLEEYFDKIENRMLIFTTEEVDTTMDPLLVFLFFITYNSSKPDSK